MIKEALKKRKESREKHGDFLDTLLEDIDKEGSIYDQESVISLLLIIGVLSKDSTSITTALTVNYISKNPKVLAELKVTTFVGLRRFTKAMHFYSFQNGFYRFLVFGF